MHDNHSQIKTIFLVEQDFLIYLLNKVDNTARIVGNNSAKGEIIIPYSISHESIEYIVTEIGECAFKEAKQIKSIQFSPNSELRTIGKASFTESSIEEITFPVHLTKIDKKAFYSCALLHSVEVPVNSELQIIESEAFSFSGIKSIYLPLHLTKICENAFFDCEDLQKIEMPLNSELITIEQGAFAFSSIENFIIPSNLVELQNGWCEENENLTNIVVSPDNPYFSLYNDEFIIRKSSIESDNYDILVFCVKNITYIQIPSFIKIIGQSAFNQCRCVEVRFSDDSELQMIDERAFYGSLIEYISIPRSLKIINECAFSNCTFLSIIDIPIDSELQTICSHAFEESIINSLSIPSKLVNLENGWCSRMLELTSISISPNNPRYIFFDDKFIFGKSNLANNDYDTIEFTCRDIKIAKIPSFISRIASSAFSFCVQLQSVEFTDDSKLKEIGNLAFFNTAIHSISLPNNIETIGISAFNSCRHLKKIYIQENSQLRKIDTHAFFKTSLVSIYFPPHLTYVSKKAFDECNYFQIIEIGENYEMKSFDNLIFDIYNDLLVMILVKLRNEFN